VGNIPAGTRPVGVVPVHPHGCGEHAGMPVDQFDGRGSSPRVWGTSPIAHEKIPADGSSPRVWGT